MSENEPFESQCDATSSIAVQLGMAGLEDPQEIGRGGFGIVYRCRQPLLDRVVAVKVLNADLEPENDARFFREQQAMGRLTGHPNIVNVLHVGTTNSGRPYIVMQYHRQGSLEAKIRKTGPIPSDEALRIGVKIAGALESAHSFGILHRDVKPGNILLSDYGEPVLTDFGIAHISGGFETSAGTVTGSPAFTAPEVFEGEPPSLAADIYGLGATLFCAISGHAAFQRLNGEGVVAQFLRIATQPAPDLRELGIPDDVSAAIGRAISVDPKLRPASAGSFGDELRQAQEQNRFNVDSMALITANGKALYEGSRTVRAEVSTRHAPSRIVEEALSMSGRLPLELTSFVGRRRELTEAKGKILESRLVTLTGIGGVGKTRMAIRAASDLLERFDDGVSIVELGELRDASLLTELVATSLGIEVQSSRQLEGLLAEFLASRDLLLVMDNCEHMVREVAKLVEFLLRASSRLHVLATSREPFNIGGEVVQRIPPLTMPAPEHETTLRALRRYDAVTLFTDRASAALPGFELNEENRHAVIQICHRLDGLPLPIEMAAARLRSMSVDQISEHLVDRFKLLTRGNRNAPTRQQTSKLSMDWSYELCTNSEQRLWARLSVFVGGFELDAAEAICAGDYAPDGLLDSLASLVDKSILIRGQSGSEIRFRMLGTLHDYGREKAEESGEYGPLMQRHQDWYRKMALKAETQWISIRQTEWIARIARELPNLRQAMGISDTMQGLNSIGLQIAGSLFPFWLTRGLFSEGRHWLDHFLSTNPKDPSIDRVKALCANSVFAEIQGDLDLAAALVQEGRMLCEHIDDRTSRARVIQAMGGLALFRGDTATACERLREALDIIGPDGDLSLRVWILNALGLAYDSHGDDRQAMFYHEQVLSITLLYGESAYRSHSLWSLGVAMWRQGNIPRATKLVEQALELTRPIGEPLTAAMCLEALAWMACSENNNKRAVVLMGAAESLVDTVESSTVLFPEFPGYHKHCEQQALRALGIRAFQTAQRRGHSMTSHEATAYALKLNAPAPRAGRSTDLSKREQQVAELVAQGMTNKSIATNLFISIRTAQGHVEHIFTKLGFNSRSQVAAWIVEQRQTDSGTSPEHFESGH